MILPRQSGSEHYLRYLAEHAPNRNSRALLSGERDAFGLLRLTVRPGFSEVDYTTAVELHRAIAERLDSTQTGHLAFDEAAVRSEVDDQIRHFNSGAHHLGTTRMSATPHSGVVDSNCKVHDLDDLFVAGGSIFVTSGCANPTLTIVAFAVRLAAHLRLQLMEGAVPVSSSPADA
jgi:choline dehydrogenase-like flavoprotein